MATTSTEALTHAWYCDILISTDRFININGYTANAESY